MKVFDTKSGKFYEILQFLVHDGFLHAVIYNNETGWKIIEINNNFIPLDRYVEVSAELALEKERRSRFGTHYSDSRSAKDIDDDYPRGGFIDSDNGLI